MSAVPAAAPHPPVGKESVARVMAAYPRVFFACHQRHVRDPEGDGELSAHQASVLSHLDTVDPTRVGDLAEHMGVTPSTMSLSLKRLERDGWVRRDPDPDDGRVVLVRLTADGDRVRRAQTVLDAELVGAVLARLEPAERTRALAGLELLASAADALVREGGGRWRERRGPPEGGAR